MQLFNYTMELNKRTNVLREFSELDPMLQAVFFEAASFTYGKFQKALLITSIKRKDGVHADRRGLDVDICDRIVYSGGVLPFEAQVITGHINGLFKYDPARDNLYVAVYGSLDPSGKHWTHIHFQTCWGKRTIFRG